MQKICGDIVRYVEQLVLGCNDDEHYVKNVYQFYSVNKKTKLRWKKRSSNILGFKCTIIIPPLKQCKKDRFIRVCQNIEFKVTE